MSLEVICSELDLDVPGAVFAGTCPDRTKGLILSWRAVRRIPESDRSSIPVDSDKIGVNIHRAVSSGSAFGGVWIEEFEFSISIQVAQKYLPNFCSRFFEEAQVTA